jgi:2',3'-cyclic-nucleotide 2'-phosphodiesterase / 3'-nucleotidase
LRFLHSGGYDMHSQKNISLTILETSDVHGHIFPILYGTNEYQPTGLAKIASYVRHVRKTEAHTILIDNGDCIQGTPLTYHYVKKQNDLPNPVIHTFNSLKYDAAIIGNHEFNYGLPILGKGISEATFPFLSANILDRQTKKPYFGTPYTIKRITEGLKIAILGLTTPYIPNWEKAEHIKGLEFEDAVESAKKWIPFIQKTEEPHFIILSYHGGFEKDLKTGEPTEALTGENQAYQLCQEVEGIDVLLTGHQHRLLADVVNGVTIIQPGNGGAIIGRVDIEFTQSSTKDWECISKKASLVSVEDWQEDDEIIKANQPYERETQKWLDQPIGHIEGDMLIKDPFQARIREHPFVEFINRVQMETAQVEISNTALFSNVAPGLPSNVTMRDIVSNYIYPNTLTVLELTGQEIKDGLEQTATYFQANEHGEIIVNPQFVEPKPQHYNYDMWEGITYTIDVSKPVGERIVTLMKNNQSLDMNQFYYVVMNNYRATGGGNYSMYKGKKVVKEIQVDMTEILANYFLKYRTVKATVNYNWKVIRS